MQMHMHLVDWAIVALYVAFAIFVGIRFAKRAEQNVDQFFLSGRSLPWWIAGTSMVATTFAIDTPLVVSGWVRDGGIWKNWLWWCFAINGVLTVFLFSRYWRRGGVMTKAELAELRYGGKSASVLRGVLGAFHAGITNTMVLCWVLLAASKAMDVLFDVPKLWALGAACVIALTYSLLAGFWGVVMTDMVQFAMAMVGAIALAFLSWNAIDGSDGLLAAATTNASFNPDSLRFLPAAGDGSVFDAAFWTIPLAAFCVYLGVSWWASEGVDGSGTSVQRICASRDDRQGMLATLWYNVAHYALRPWPWILVALASLVVLPHVTVEAPVDGVVTRIGDGEIVLNTDGNEAAVQLDAEGLSETWTLDVEVDEGDEVAAGEVLAKTDSERAYVAMMVKYLPIGLLGLVVASLLAAFMSTVDTHVNLASSFFVNDVYRRFLVPDRGPKHYVYVAQAASVVVLAMGAAVAYPAQSIGGLFLLFLALLGGAGPIFALRWLWWRIRASTEIAAIVASSTATIVLTFVDFEWRLGALAEDGNLLPEGRLILVVVFSLACALLSLLVTKTPDPATLVEFYRRVRPVGWWGPVRALAPDVEPPREGLPAFVGTVSGLAAIYGPMLGVGCWFLQRRTETGIAAVVTIAGIAGVVWSLRRVATGIRSEPEPPR